MKLQAIKGHVIVQAIETENVTESGLILQSDYKKQTEARVVSVGVIVDWNRVGKVSFENETYYVTGQSNILGVFED